MRERLRFSSNEIEKKRRKKFRERKAKEGKKRRRLPGAVGWMNIKALAGKGSGYKPPTAALLLCWGSAKQSARFWQSLILG